MGEKERGFPPAPFVIHELPANKGGVSVVECQVIKKKGQAVVLIDPTALEYAGPDGLPKYTEDCCRCLAVVLRNGQLSSLFHISPAFLGDWSAYKEFKLKLKCFKSRADGNTTDGLICGGLSSYWPYTKEYVRLSGHVYVAIKEIFPRINLIQLSPKKESGLTNVYVSAGDSEVWILSSPPPY